MAKCPYCNGKNLYIRRTNPMEKYRKAENELGGLNRQIARKKRDIKNLQEKLKELEEKQRKYTNTFVRDIIYFF